ncbi:MAG: hypothetical protein RIS64_4045 [Bacteroidota bacterium]|jgi:hypothetical protein
MNGKNLYKDTNLFLIFQMRPIKLYKIVQKIEIPLKKQKEGRELFKTEKATYLSLQTQIAQTETAIDTLVYAHYDLTAEAIQLIENQ